MWEQSIHTVHAKLRCNHMAIKLEYPIVLSGIYCFFCGSLGLSGMFKMASPISIAYMGVCDIVSYIFLPVNVL